MVCWPGARSSSCWPCAWPGDRRPQQRRCGRCGGGDVHPDRVAPLPGDSVEAGPAADGGLAQAQGCTGRVRGRQRLDELTRTGVMAVLVRRAGGPGVWSVRASGGDGDASADGPSLLKLVDEGDRVVLGADGALAAGTGEQLVAAQAVGAGEPRPDETLTTVTDRNYRVRRGEGAVDYAKRDGRPIQNDPAGSQRQREPSASTWPRPGRRSRDYAGLRPWKVRRRSLTQAPGFSQGMKWPPWSWALTLTWLHQPAWGLVLNARTRSSAVWTPGGFS
jgi:hypothetical protein